MSTIHSSLPDGHRTAAMQSAPPLKPPVSFSRILELQTWRMLGLVLAIGVMWAVFQVLTEGSFVSPRNLSNLAVQTSVTALLAVGMTWLMVARQIDFSGGALIALLGVIAAKTQVALGWPFVGTLAVLIALGALVGLGQAMLVTRLAIPAFITTLAAFSYLRGTAFIISDGMTVAGLGDRFALVANANIPPAVSVALFLAMAVAVAVFRIQAWRRSPGPVRPVDVAAALTLIACLVVSAWAFGSYRGIPAPVVAALLVVMIATVVADHTAFGRHIYAVGANPEAARRAGIKVKGMLVALFVLSSLLATLGSLIQTSRLDAGSPGTAEFLSLEAISAAVIGGTSLFGGRGTVAGSALGALLMATIANGLSLMGVNTYWQLVTTGALLILALTVDRVTGKEEAA